MLVCDMHSLLANKQSANNALEIRNGSERKMRRSVTYIRFSNALRLEENIV